MATFISRTARVVNWDIDNAIEEEEPASPVLPPEPASPVLPPEPVFTPPTIFQKAVQSLTSYRIGNDPQAVMQRRFNNQAVMQRKLNNAERDQIRADFAFRNGQLEQEDCANLKALLDPVILLFQVTGFVSYLHREVALGRTQVRDLNAYMEWMQTKYTNLWAQYNRPRFVSCRLSNNLLRNTGQAGSVNIALEDIPILQQFSTMPTIKPFPRRGGFKG